jgi:hypothetical protein
VAVRTTIIFCTDIVCLGSLIVRAQHNAAAGEAPALAPRRVFTQPRPFGDIDPPQGGRTLIVNGPDPGPLKQRNEREAPHGEPDGGA